MAEYNNTEMSILEAAEAIFLEKGYNRASTTRIAQQAGVTHAMLHYYFRTKEQIFLKILDKEVEAMISSVRGIMSPEATLWETLEKVIALNFDFLNNNRRLPFLLLDVADNNPEMLERYKQGVSTAVNSEFMLHAGRIRKWIDSEVINDIDPLQLVCDILSANVSAFLAVPFLENVLKFSEEQVDGFLRDRKREIIRTMYLRLNIKGGR